MRSQIGGRNYPGETVKNEELDKDVRDLADYIPEEVKFVKEELKKEIVGRSEFDEAVILPDSWTRKVKASRAVSGYLMNPVDNTIKKFVALVAYPSREEKPVVRGYVEKASTATDVVSWILFESNKEPVEI